MEDKKSILVLDPWHGVASGAGKKSLYEALAKHYDLHFVRVELPSGFKFWNYAVTFHPQIAKWKHRYGIRVEYVQKYPRTHRLVTRLYSHAVERFTGDYDAILQISSLFGPAANPKGVPYFTYQDSTVRNPVLKLREWMPPDFARYRKEWYALETSYFKSLAGIMTYSQWVKDTLVNRYGIEGEKIHVVGSALKIATDVEIDWSKRRREIVFVSTEFARKGGYKLADIFRKVREALPDAKMSIVGKIPPDFDVAEYPGMTALGPLKRPQLVEVYQRASVLLHPPDYDAFPSVILEAANFEIPAVASKICGIPEMIKDGETGFLVDLFDVNGFQDKLIAILKDPHQLQEMGKKARQYVREKFHPQVVADNVSRVIEQSLVKRS